MDDKITVYLNDDSITATIGDDSMNVAMADYVTFEQKDYNKLNNKPRINGVTLQGDKSALDLRLVPIDLSPFEAVSEPTRDFRQQADIFISHNGNGFRMALQAVKDMNTKIITSDSFAKVDFDKLDKGDFIYITR